VETLNTLAKIQLTNVNYKGAPQLATDVVGGHVQVGVITPPSILAFHKDKRIRALGITGSSRLTAMPTVPTVAEAAGLPDYNIQTWFALAGPANLPKPVVTQLQQNLQKVIADADMRGRLVSVGMEPATDAATDKAAAMIQSEHDRLGKMIQAAGIRPE
jgi:tripartite-type tricarboxylate transporter receptor subunit TctC